MPKGHRGILITGSQMPDLLRDNLRQIAATRDDLTLVDFVSEPIALMAGATRIIAMGGITPSAKLKLDVTVDRTNLSEESMSQYNGFFYYFIPCH